MNIEHDPESGCKGILIGCPFLRLVRTAGGTMAEGCGANANQPTGSPAPPWCPLRAGPVTVRAPGPAETVRFVCEEHGVVKARVGHAYFCPKGWHVVGFPHAQPWREHPIHEVLRAAPVDEEPLSESEDAAIEEAREDVRAGRVGPLPERCKLCGSTDHETMMVMGDLKVTVCPKVPDSMGWLLISGKAKS